MWNEVLSAVRVGLGEAFAYVDGKLWYGKNHLELVDKIRDSGIEPYETEHSAFGYVWTLSDSTEEAEFYSDFWQSKQDPDIFDKVYEKLKKRYPNLRSLTHGPDQATIAEMEKYSANEARTLYDYLNEDTAAMGAYEGLANAGGRVYIVGGAVRDVMLNKPPKDIDLMVTGLDQSKIEDVLRQLPGKTKMVGKQFGIYLYKDGGNTVEIAMPRREESKGVGHKDFDVRVSPDISVEEDLTRRDFTANAMAFDIASGQIIDPHNGQEDIAKRSLRVVNHQAFRDDPLRIVRALVAYSVNGLKPDDFTLDEMSKNGSSIRHLSEERIRMELNKLLSGNDPSGALMIADECGLLDYICPELAEAMDFDQQSKYHDLTVGDHTLAVLSHITHLTDDPKVRLAALFHDLGKPSTFWKDEEGYGHFYKTPSVPESRDHEDVSAEMAKEFMKRMGYSNNDIDRVTNIIQHHMFPYFSTEAGARKFINKVGDPDTAHDLINLRDADAHGKRDGTTSPDEEATIQNQRDLVNRVVANQDATSQTNIAVNGHDIMALGVPAGPQIGHILRTLTGLVLDNPSMNTRDTLLQYARENLLYATANN
jgi:tRNA nucleotidyltransferase (CCA-adding enzyme)